MKYLIGIILGLSLLGLAFWGEVRNERTNSQIALEETVAAARFVYEERTATEEHNSEILRRFVSGEITEEVANSLMIEPPERKRIFISFTRMDGPITFGAYDPTQDPHATPRFGLTSCVMWAGENNYNCGDEGGSRVKCVIYVIRETGPMAGTTFYSKKCDGLPICRRTADPLTDGYVITYDDFVFIPKK